MDLTRTSFLFLRTLALGLCLGGVAGVRSTMAQDVDPALWGVGDGASVTAIARSGNTIYLGGYFKSIAPSSGGGVPYLRAGAPWSAFPKVAGYVLAAVTDGAGGWFVGGAFGGIGGVPCKNLAHILQNGKVANWAPNPDGIVWGMTLKGKTLYVGGEFTQVAGQPRAYVAAVDIFTALPTAWHPQPNSVVRAILPLERTVLLGGAFRAVNGEPRSRLAEVDLLTGTPTHWNPGPSDQVRTFAVSGTTLFVGGDFFDVGGVTRKFLAAFDLASKRMLPWDAGISRRPDYFYDGGPRVTSLLIRDSLLFVGGAFGRLGGADRQGLGAVSVSTGKASDWDPRARYADGFTFLPATIRSMSLDGTTLYVAGSLDSLGGRAVTAAGAIDTQTGQGLDWRPGLRGVEVVVVSGDAIYVGGEFTTLGPAVPRRSLAALDATTGMVTDWNPGTDDFIKAIACHDGVIYVAGTFSEVGGEVRHGLAAVDSARGVALPWNPSFGGPVWSMAVKDTTIYAGGSFETVGGQPRANLAAVSTISGLPTSWAPNPNDMVTAVLPSGTTIYAGGFFTSLGGERRKWIGAVDAASGLATPWTVDSDVGAMSCFAVEDTVVYIGGDFGRVNGETRENIAAVSARTGALTSFVANSSDGIQTLLLADGVLYAGGFFRAINGKSRDYIAAMNPRTGAVLDWNPGAGGGVWAFAPGGDRIYAGGRFDWMGPRPTGLIASIAGAATPGTEPGSGGWLRSLQAANPVSTLGSITFSLTSPAVVDMQIFDLQGRRMSRPLNTLRLGPGHHVVPVDASTWPMGFYFCRVDVGVESRAVKFTVLR